MSKTLRTILKIALPLLLGGAILWWMYRGFDWEGVRVALSSEMNWWWMLASLPFGVLAQVLRGLRWRQLLRPTGESPRAGTAINAIFLSYATSLVVPRVGEVLRCGVLKRYDGISFSKGIGTVVTERIIDIVIVAVLSLIVFVTQIPDFIAFFHETGMSLQSLTSRFTPAGIFVTVASVVVIGIMAVWLLRRAQLFSRTRSTLDELRQGLLSIARIEGRTLFLAYSIGIWVCYFLHFYLTFFCFAATRGLGIGVALLAFVVGTFAVLVPTPNGAGPWHFAVKTVLMLKGTPSDLAALFALVVHTIQTLLVALLGLYSTIRLYFLKASIGCK